MAWHARLSASTAKRWLNCPGSIREIDAWYDAHPELRERDEESPYAKEGTRAHSLLHHCLEPVAHLLEPQGHGGWWEPLDPMALVGHWVTDNGAVVARADPFSDAMEVTDDMASAVAVCIERVMEEANRLCEQGGRPPSMMLEQRFDLTWVHPDLGGTSDVTMDVFLEELVVVDYKHGRGVVVEVDDNEQLLSYLVSAARQSGFTHERYKIIIVQPRAAHSDGPCREQTFTRAQVLAFVDRLREGARRTEDPDAPLAGGDWCRFCPKSGNCPAQDAMVQSMAALDFADPVDDHELPAITDDPQALADRLRWVPVLDAWIKGVTTAAMRMACVGIPIPGSKLVAGRSSRVISVPVDTLKLAAEQKGLPIDRLYQDPKLRSVRQIELLGKPWKQLLAAKDAKTGDLLYVEKRPGRPKLVPDTDPRDAIPPPGVADFEDEPDDGPGED